MIIKNLTRKSPSYLQLLWYVANSPDRLIEKGKEAWEIRHNLGNSKTLEDMAKHFRENDKLRANRKGGIALHHSILSWSNLDQDKVTPDMVRDMVKHYIGLRNDRAIYYAVIHQADHPHVHLVSSNSEIITGKSLRISRTDFQSLKTQMEQYQRTRYPQLECSQVNHKQRAGKSQSRNEYSLKARTTDTEKSRIAKQVNAALQRAASTDTLITLLEKENLPTYTRGNKLYGVIAPSGRKYRFASMELDPIAELAKRTERQRTIEKTRNNREKQRTIEQ